MPLTTNISIGIRAELTGTADLSTPRDLLNYSFSQVLTSGTGASQADKLFHDTRTLTTGASEDIDLAGSLTDGFGQTITFAKIKLVLIRNKSTARTLTVGNATDALVNWVGAANDVINIGPGGVLFLMAPGTAGYAVTPDTADDIKILNDSGSSCEYDIIIIGTSA